jgi:hypothetical protein
VTLHCATVVEEQCTFVQFVIISLNELNGILWYLANTTGTKSQSCVSTKTKKSRDNDSFIMN